MPPSSPRVTRDNWLAPQNLRWALRHSRQVIPTVPIGRGAGPVRPLNRSKSIDLDAITFDDAGASMRLVDLLQRSAVDAFLVLHRGQIVYERLLEGMTREQPHQWASMSKSLNGLLAVVIAQAGLLDLQRPLGHYVPELADSPFGTATVQQNLDMEVAVEWPVHVTEMHWMAAVGLVPPITGVPTTIRDFLPRVGVSGTGRHGSGFRYNNSATEAVAWALCNAAGKPWFDLVSEQIWTRLGAEQDGFVIVDSVGVAQASGGFSSTIGDLARLAELLRTGGAQIGDATLSSAIRHATAAHKPAERGAAVERFAGGNIAVGRPGFGYRNGLFHVNDADGCFQMSGRFGQRVHVNPAAELTVVQFASYPGPGEQIASAFLSAMRAIAGAVAGLS